MGRFFSILKRRPIAIISFIVLCILYIMMFFAEFLSPYTPSTNFRYHSYHSPNLTFYSDKYGICPQVQKTVLVNEVKFEYVRVKGEYFKIKFFVKGPEYYFWGLFKTDVHLFGIDDPYKDNGTTWESGGKNYPAFLFGADHLGRDIFSRILYGARISLTIGFIGISITLILSIILGGLAGYYGGILDWLIMRATEFIMLIPGLYLILFLRSILSKDLDSGQTFILVTVILSFVGWPSQARLIRGLVHSIKREDFIQAAQLHSMPALVIIFRQIIPQMSSLIIVSIALGIPGFILGETALSYLGLGIVDPAVSWGSMLNKEITTIINMTYYPWLLYPGLFLILVTLSFNFIGDLLRDVMDPFHRERSLG